MIWDLAAGQSRWHLGRGRSGVGKTTTCAATVTQPERWHQAARCRQASSPREFEKAPGSSEVSVQARGVWFGLAGEREWHGYSDSLCFLEKKKEKEPQEPVSTSLGPSHDASAFRNPLGFWTLRWTLENFIGLRIGDPWRGRAHEVCGRGHPVAQRRREHAQTSIFRKHEKRIIKMQSNSY